MMNKIKLITIGLLSLSLTTIPINNHAQNDIPLKSVPIQEIQTDLGLDEQIWGNLGKPGDRQALLTAISHSLTYLNSPSAAKVYQNYPIPSITRDRVKRSLLRFQTLVKTSQSPAELQAAIQREFVLYQSIGKDQQGTVGFTGYFVPTYSASRTPNATYRYPLYRKPTDFSRWSNPHPTRLELEGEDGLLGEKSRLSGYELVWLSDRLEAFLVQVQGSAQLQLTDGKIMTIGYSGSTDYPYTSIGRELVNDGIFPLEELTLPRLIAYFRENPSEMNRYIPRNERFIFFKETKGAPARGSIGVPVTADRSIATDKSLMPPGALALIYTQIPYIDQTGEIDSRWVSRYVLDQDTGSAIKGPGRVDIFMGTGKTAGDRAGLVNSTGQLYYLLLKN
jgi:membrane-bound lytic murein transglycosylase A